MDGTGHGQGNSPEKWMVDLAEEFAGHPQGFEFRVSFRTRFGETKTEKLQPALDLFQNMRVFKPHVNLQKSGIRLVVTRWDGENFLEEPGIENVEHASPEEVEDLIRAHLQGSPEPGVTGAGAPKPRRKSPVIALSVVKRLHDPRFHLLVRRQDGATEEGPVLIRSNLAKLRADRLIDPAVTLSMTALNDRITITRARPVDGKMVVTSETLPLLSDSDAKNLERTLQECLPPIEELPPTGAVSSVATPLAMTRRPVPAATS